MRVATLSAVLIGSVVVACFVDRPSEELTCSSDSQCTGYDEPRACTGGYCVASDCPAGCTACDEDLRTCQIDCTSTDDCAGTITCPSGWTCTVSCVGDGACNDVECQSGSRCAIACMGDNACGDIRCVNACQCDLDCVGTACVSMSCPSRGNGANQVRCTADGTSGTECDSTVDNRCTQC